VQVTVGQPGQLGTLPTPHLARTPPTRTGTKSEAQRSQIVNLLVYSHMYLPSADIVTVAGSGQDSQHNTDFDPDMLTDHGTSTS